MNKIRDNIDLIDWEIRKGFRPEPQGYYDKPRGAPLIMPKEQFMEKFMLARENKKRSSGLGKYKIENRPLCVKCGGDKLHSKGIVIRDGKKMREWQCQKCYKRFKVPEVG